MKKYSYLFLALLTLALTACSSDDPQPSNPNQPDTPIVVSVDNDGKADGGHTFEMIDETNFYIDDIKYTAKQGELYVSGYHPTFFSGEAKIVSALKYHGRELKVTRIGRFVFNMCDILTAITIHDGVKEIASSFYGCPNLSSVKIPKSVTSIEDAFGACPSLPVIDNIRYADTYLVEAIDKTQTSYIIKEGTRYIGNESFRGCPLTSFNVPEGIISIGKAAFCDCKNLTSVSIPETVMSIGPMAFRGCNSLSYLNIDCPIVEMWFNDLPALKEVVLGDKVTGLGEWTFRHCSALTTINIPESVKTIGKESFYGCTSLSDIYCYIKEPLALSHPIFDNYSTTLHVPAESVEKYKAAKGWNFLKNIVAI